jgi:hypothetical protein
VAVSVPVRPNEGLRGLRLFRAAAVIDGDVGAVFRKPDRDGLANA